MDHPKISEIITPEQADALIKWIEYTQWQYTFPKAKNRDQRAEYAGSAKFAKLLIGIIDHQARTK